MVEFFVFFQVLVSSLSYSEGKSYEVVSLPMRRESWTPGSKEERWQDALLLSSHNSRSCSWTLAPVSLEIRWEVLWLWLSPQWRQLWRCYQVIKWGTPRSSRLSADLDASFISLMLMNSVHPKFSRSAFKDLPLIQPNETLLFRFHSSFCGSLPFQNGFIALMVADLGDQLKGIWFLTELWTLMKIPAWVFLLHICPETHGSGWLPSSSCHCLLVQHLNCCRCRYVENGLDTIHKRWFGTFIGFILAAATL